MKYRLARLADSDALASIAHACAPELSDSFTLQLGLPFQKAYYKAMLSEPTTVAACAEDDGGRIAGFALATLDSSSMVDAARRAKFSLAMAACWGIVRRPYLLTGIICRVASLLGKDRGSSYVVGHGAKVSFLAVDPADRSSHAGPRLMKYVINSLREKSSVAISAEVDQSNPRVIRLHERLGASVVRKFTTPSAVPRVILEYPITNKRSAA